MKIAITGHSRGIGKACYDLLSQTHDCMGFSKSNGFNINEPKRILIATRNCDVFINNAYQLNTADQLNIFNSLFEQWKNDSSKHIINIGSKSKYFPHNENHPEHTEHKRSSKEYNDSKTDLANSIYQKQLFTKKKCKITTINPGYVKTDFTQRIHDQVNMLQPIDLANIIKWVVEQPKHIEIGDLGVWHPSER